MGFIFRCLATAVAAAAAVWLVPGIEIIGGGEAWTSIAIFAVTLSLVNMIVKPIVSALSLPLSCLTFGLFSLVINVLMLYLAAWLANEMFGAGFYIDGFFSALFASIVISIVSSVVNAVIDRG